MTARAGSLRRRASKRRVHAAIDAAAKQVWAAKAPVLLIGGQACRERGLAAAERISAAGVRVLTDTFVLRQPRGGGRFSRRTPAPYFGEIGALRTWRAQT